MQRKNLYLYGIIAIFIAAILFGIAGAFAKVLFHADISPFDLTAVRSLVACAVFASAILATQPRAFRVTPATFPLLIATGLAFTAVNVTFYLSISMISVATAITLEYTAPFFVMLISVILGSRRIDIRDVGIVALSIVGCFFLTGGKTEVLSVNSGVLMGLACGLSFAVFNMLGNICKRRGLVASTVTLYAFLVSTVIWLFAMPALTVNTIVFSKEIVLYIGFIAIIATIIPYWLLIYGLRYVDALPATIIGMLDPMVAGVAAFLLLGERLTLINMTGILIILISVFLITLKENSQKKEALPQPS